MESLHRNMELLLEFLKTPFLVPHFSYNTLMTFLTMLSVILLSMLMILFSILSVIRYLICDSNLNWILNLNLIYKTLSTGVRSETQLVLFDRSNNNVSIDVKVNGSVLEEKSSFKMLGLALFSKLDGARTLSLLLKLPPRKLKC